VLVNALLVIPAATAKLLARSLGQMFVLAPAARDRQRPRRPDGVLLGRRAGLLFLAAWGRIAWGARSRLLRHGNASPHARADYLSTWYPRRAEERRAYLERLGKSTLVWLATPDTDTV
jgi:ABC 3 transport family